jgi:hypothetical protein
MTMWTYRRGYTLEEAKLQLQDAIRVHDVAEREMRDLQNYNKVSMPREVDKLMNFNVSRNSSYLSRKGDKLGRRSGSEPPLTLKAFSSSSWRCEVLKAMCI